MVLSFLMKREVYAQSGLLFLRKVDTSAQSGPLPSMLVGAYASLTTRAVCLPVHCTVLYTPPAPLWSVIDSSEGQRRLLEEPKRGERQ